jgi:tetratricopeptide (TPR) repeat protein
VSPYYWKSTWYPGFQSPAFLYLAEMKSVAGDYEEALDLIDRSLEYSGRSTLSKFVKSFILTKLGREEEAKTLLKENIAFDRLDFLSLVEIARLNNDYKALADVISHMGIPLQEVLEVSTYYGAVGGYDEAVRLLDFAMANGSEFSSTPMQKNAVEPFTASPLLNYMAGYYSNLAGKTDKAKEYYAKAVTMSPDYCFPSRVEEEAMLRDAIAVNPDDSKAHYYLGNLLYFRDRKDEAISEWKESSRLNPNYGMVFRNLGFAANNYLSDKEAAADYYRKAIEADRTDPKFFTELDIIEEAQKVPSKERLAFMDKNKATVFKSDDATSRLVYLYVENGQYDKALNILESRHFRVWEGGKTAYTPFVDAHLLSGLDQLAKHKNQKALEHFLAAGTFPRNLETNELSTGPIVAKVAYFQGLAYKAFGQTEDASKAFQRCVDAANDGSDGRLDESRYFLAMAYKEMGNEAESKKVLSDVQQKLDDLNKAGSAAAVDIYSKFGEDGSSDVVKARNIYVQGLVCLAEGRKSEAHEYFAKSLELDSSNVWASYFLKASR